MSCQSPVNLKSMLV